ncbi:hypothetical protein [Brucella pituitosa]
MDATQRVVAACCLLGMLFVGIGAFFFSQWMNERKYANERQASEIIECENRIKTTNRYSLVLTDKNVQAALACADKYPQFKSFKVLFDERSPNSPLKKADN